MMPMEIFTDFCFVSSKMMPEANKGTPTPISAMALQWHFMGIVLPFGSSIERP